MTVLGLTDRIYKASISLSESMNLSEQGFNYLYGIINKTKYPSWDSNPDCIDFKSTASTDWARGA